MCECCNGGGIHFGVEAYLLSLHKNFSGVNFWSPLIPQCALTRYLYIIITTTTTTTNTTTTTTMCWLQDIHEVKNRTCGIVTDQRWCARWYNPVFCSCLKDVRLESSDHMTSAASLRLMLPVASGSAPQLVAISSSCHVIVAPSSAVGRFLLQVRQPGTRCQTISVIRRLAKTLLGDCWRHTCLRCIRACSALEALCNALYKCSTYLLTCILWEIVPIAVGVVRKNERSVKMRSVRFLPCDCIHRVRKKGATLFLPVTLRNANRFSKFFYRHTLQ